MPTSTARGRARQRALFDFLAAYPVATTDQLATLIWAGDQHLARTHLLGYLRAGLLRRLPHPLYRNGAYVYTRSERSTTHGQKVLHHLAEVEFHLAIVRHLGRYGARVLHELPWAPGLIPDQTVIWRDTVWAVEHHLSGQFGHAPDYQRFMEEEAYTLCHWWRPGLRIGLLVVTAQTAVDRVRVTLRRHDSPGLTWRVTSPETVLRDPGPLLQLVDRRKPVEAQQFVAGDASRPQSQPVDDARRLHHSAVEAIKERRKNAGQDSRRQNGGGN